MILYPICVYPQKKGAVEIELPDFNFTVKGSDMISAMSAAVETVTAIYNYRLAKDKEIPEPSRICDIKFVRKMRKGFKTLVYVDTE